jgi:hypothetical protein
MRLHRVRSRVSWQVFGAGIVALFAWIGFDPPPATDKWFASLAALVGVAFGAVVCVYVSRARLEIRPGRLRVRRILGWKEIDFREVAGVREHENSYVFEHRDGQTRVVVWKGFDFDNTFSRFRARLPNLNVIDERRDRETLADDATLGATPRERLAHVGRVRRECRWLAAAVFGLWIWRFVYPGPPYLFLVATIAAPWLLVGFAALRAPGLVRLFTTDNVRPHLSGSLVFAVLATAILAWSDEVTFLVSGWTVLVCGIVVGAPLCVLALRVDPPGPVGLRSAMGAAAVVGLSALYGAGASAGANVLLDHGQPTVEKVPVVGARAASYRSRGIYWLEFEDYGELRVEQSLFNSSRVGDRVCVLIHPGALGWEWATVYRCAGPT